MSNLSIKAIKVAQRMAAGEIFYSRLSPRLSPIIRDELRREGFEIQSESPRHESTFYYPLHLDKFKSKLARLIKAQSETSPSSPPADNESHSGQFYSK